MATTWPHVRWSSCWSSHMCHGSDSPWASGSVCATRSHEFNVRKTLQPWPLPGNSSSPVHSPAGKVCPIENSTDTLNSPKGQLTAIPWHLANPLPDYISVGGINVSQAIRLKGLRIFLIPASPLLPQTQAFLYTSHHAARDTPDSLRGSGPCLSSGLVSPPWNCHFFFNTEPCIFLHWDLQIM